MIPKDHWTLQWKGLNLYNKDRVLKMASFEGWGSLGINKTTSTGSFSFLQLCNHLTDLFRPRYWWEIYPSNGLEGKKQPNSFLLVAFNKTMVDTDFSMFSRHWLVWHLVLTCASPPKKKTSMKFVRKISPKNTPTPKKYPNLLLLQKIPKATSVGWKKSSLNFLRTCLRLPQL